MRRSPCRVLSALLLSLSLMRSWPAMAAAIPAAGFQTVAPIAILLDMGTGTVLLDKNADTLVSPASTAKLMTVELVFREIKEGRLRLDDSFIVSEHAWRTGGAVAGALSMFALPNSRIPVGDLLKGLIVDSANDAAIALAEGVAGTEERFAALMNRRARDLGLTKSTFANPWGRADPNQKVTARDMARLAAHVITTYPDLYPLFALREFTWNKVRQFNRNPLLAMNLGADGLYTGDLPDSGFGLVASALQNGQRLILVVNGLRTARERASEATKLLAWGLRAFEPRQIYAAGETVGAARVYGGAVAEVPLVTETAVTALVPRGGDERLSGKITYLGPIPAPVAAGTRVGEVRVFVGSTEVMSAPLRAGAAVPAGSLPMRAMDAGVELVTTLIRQNFTRH